MTSGTNRNPDAVCICGKLSRWSICRCFIFRFVEFETYLRQIVQFRNVTAFDLGLDAALEDAVQERVDVRLLSKVEE